MKQLKQIFLFFFILQAFLEFFQVYYHLALAGFVISVFLGLVWVLLKPDNPLIDRKNILPMGFLTFWLGYSLFTYIWAHDNIRALTYSIWILRYLLTFLLFSHVFKTKWIRDNFFWFVISILFLYLVTAVYEIITWNHLPSSRYHGVMVPIPTGPFYNENNLAAYMLLFSPFILFLPKIVSRNWLNLISIILIVIITAIMVVQGARIALFGMAAFVLYYFIRHITWQYKLVSVGLVMLMIYGFSVYYPQYSRIANSAVDHQISSLSEERQSIRMSSVKIRAQLINETVDMFSATAGMGVGGGNYETMMLKGPKYRSGGITNPHNYLMELLGNFGIMVFIGFLGLYTHWLCRLYKRYRSIHGQRRYLFLMYLSSLLLFIPSSSLPSSIRWDFFIWIYFAAINAVAHEEIILMPEKGVSLSE